MPTTFRIALLAGLLALLCNLAVIGFIYWRTHDEAVSEMRQQVVEQDKVLTDVFRTGGEPALTDAVQDTIAYADPQDGGCAAQRQGARANRQHRSACSQAHLTEGPRSTFLRLRGQTDAARGALVMYTI